MVTIDWDFVIFTTIVYFAARIFVACAGNYTVLIPLALMFALVPTYAVGVLVLVGVALTMYDLRNILKFIYQ